jgi:hypothetical protein
MGGRASQEHGYGKLRWLRRGRETKDILAVHDLEAYSLYMHLRNCIQRPEVVTSLSMR